MKDRAAREDRGPERRRRRDRPRLRRPAAGGRIREGRLPRDRLRRERARRRRCSCAASRTSRTCRPRTSRRSCKSGQVRGDDRRGAPRARRTRSRSPCRRRWQDARSRHELRASPRPRRRRGRRTRACSSCSRARRIRARRARCCMPALERARTRRSARTSSSRSARSASIPATRSTTRRTRPRSSAASRRPAPSSRSALYASCIDTIVRVSSPEAAELVKLLENTFRSVNIGLVNEMAIVCDKLGVDVWEVIDAAATKPFGFMKFTPGPGIGGHCIPLDPHYLAWKMRTLNYKTRFIDLASEINSQMPAFVVEKVAQALNDDRKAGQRQPHPRARRRVQARHRRRARESRARRDPPARGAGRDGRVPRSVHPTVCARTGTSAKASRSRRTELAAADAVVIVTDHRDGRLPDGDGPRVARSSTAATSRASSSRTKARVVSLVGDASNGDAAD